MYNTRDVCLHNDPPARKFQLIANEHFQRLVFLIPSTHGYVHNDTGQRQERSFQETMPALRLPLLAITTPLTLTSTIIIELLHSKPRSYVRTIWECALWRIVTCRSVNNAHTAGVLCEVVHIVIFTLTFKKKRARCSRFANTPFRVGTAASQTSGPSELLTFLKKCFYSH